DGGETLELPRPGLVGEHQVENAGLAVMAARALGALAPRPEAIARGLREASWPARLQTLARGPLAGAMPPGSALWLDGGHNPGAGEALARTLAARPDFRPLHLVIGMLSNKDARGFLDPLVGHVASLQAVPIGEHLSHAPETIVATARELGMPASAAATPLAAIRSIAAQATGPVRVLVCGSLYLAGTVLAENG
ncbi:MAG: bifunctional folylpolyglutamate synthase/dihydrofolate synthase, partial [Geminicoccaceae bacterium]